MCETKIILLAIASIMFIFAVLNLCYGNVYFN